MHRVALALALLLAAPGAWADTIASCDGFSGTNGAMSSGSTTLTSAFSTFTTTASAGMTFTVSGAGANQSAKSAVVHSGSGGTGYTALDVLTLSDGTKLEVITAPAGVITGVRVHTRVSQASPPSNPVSHSSGGTGTGATFDLTFTRDNLVTTISSVTNNTTLVLASANASGAAVSSARYGGGTPKDSAVATAFTNSNEAILPRGECLFTGTVNVGSGQAFIGKGPGKKRQGTSILWAGAVNGTQVTADNGSAVTSALIGNFDVEGNGGAFYGVKLTSLRDSYVLPITAVGQTGIAIVIDGRAWNVPGTYTTYESLSAFATGGVSDNADGIYLGLTDNVTFNKFNRLFVQHKYGRGTVCGDAIGNTIAMDTEQRVGGGTAYGLSFNGSGASRGACKSNRFVQSDANGDTYIYGTESGYAVASSRNNISVNSTNGAALPAKDISATVLCDSTYGAEGNNCSNIDVAGAMNYKNKVLNKTANYTLKATDSGRFFTNKGAAGQVNFTLPTAAGAGYRACFARAEAFKLLIDVSGTDIIKAPGGLVSTAGGDFYSSTADSAICLVDISTERWQAEKIIGTWVAE